VRKVAAVLVILLILGGVFYVQQTSERGGQRLRNLEEQLDRLRRENEALREELERTRSQLKEGHPVTLYFIEAGERDFYLVPETRIVRGEDLPTAALRELAAGPGPDSPLNRCLPPGTKVLGVEIKDKIAQCNFSQEIITNFNWGSSLEALMVKAIANTLTEFPAIEGVLILVEGETVETIGGHLSADEIFRRDEEVVRRS
jgi:spore germination protein GerM